MDDILFNVIQLKQKGYCCSQIMFIMALQSVGKTNADLVRAVQGLCYGVAMSGEICGVFSGGACLLSFYAGKGSEEEETDERIVSMMRELTEWFREFIGKEYGGIRCSDILNRYPDKSACGKLVLNTYAKVMEILTTHSFIPTTERKL